MAYIVNVQLLLDTSTDGESCDAVNEILREQQRTFAPQSCLIDYAISGPIQKDVDLDNYEEGDAFHGEEPTR